MADETSIFNENASKRLKSPDIVDEYLRTNKLAILAVFFACAALLVGLLAWGIFGTVTASVTTQGTYDELIEQGGLFAELVAKQRLDA